MKTLCIIAVCLAGTALLQAQKSSTMPASHDIAIIELTWTRKLSPPSRQFSEEEPSGGLRSNPDGNAHKPSAVPGNPFPYRMKLPYFYVYSLTVKNVGTKKIRGIYWDYVSSDLASGAELGRRKIINYEGIAPGKVKTLRVEYSSPPTNLVTPEGLGKDERSPFKSTAEIKCVLYRDSTVWHDPSEKEEICSELRQVDRRVRKRK